MEGESLCDCVILDQMIILHDEMMIVPAAKWPEDQDLVLCNQDHHNGIITGKNNWQAMVLIIKAQEKMPYNICSRGEF